MTMTVLACLTDEGDAAAPRAPFQTITPALLERIRGEFLEMPGLRVTLGQAMRLWQLDAVTCDVALRTLVEEGFLRKTRQTAFQRADA